LALVTCRLIGIALVLPISPSPAMPAKLRLAAALVVALGVVGRIEPLVSLPDGLAGVALAVAGELLIGAGIGYAARVLLSGVALGAMHVAQQMGLALGESLNPLGSEAGGPVRSLFGLLAVATFLLIGGHRDLIAAVMDTFRAVAPAGRVAVDSLPQAAAGLLAVSFALALNVAAAVLVTMLVATAAMGMLQRTLPQCNLLTVYLPVRTLLAMIALAGSLMLMRPIVRTATDWLVNGLAAVA